MQTNSAMTTVVLANACELVYSVFSNVAGNDVANSINGSMMTRDLVNQVTLAQIKNNLAKSTGGV